jgi:hypothetical protein
MHATRLLVALGATLIFITACGQENRTTMSAQEHDKRADGASNGSAIIVASAGYNLPLVR